MTEVASSSTVRRKRSSMRSPNVYTTTQGQRTLSQRRGGRPRTPLGSLIGTVPMSGGIKPTAPSSPDKHRTNRLRQMDRGQSSQTSRSGRVHRPVDVSSRGCLGKCHGPFSNQDNAHKDTHLQHTLSSPRAKHAIDHRAVARLDWKTLLRVQSGKSSSG